jgi:hypothetical protein
MAREQAMAQQKFHHHNGSRKCPDRYVPGRRQRKEWQNWLLLHPGTGRQNNGTFHLQVPEEELGNVNGRFQNAA